jgi:hypothetical protein
MDSTYAQCRTNRPSGHGPLPRPALFAGSINNLKSTLQDDHHTPAIIIGLQRNNHLKTKLSPPTFILSWPS